MVFSGVANMLYIASMKQSRGVLPPGGGHLGIFWVGINTFCSVGSYHRIVTAKIRLSLRQSKPSGKKKIRYDWNKLLNDNIIKDMYTVEVCNRYQALQDLHGNEDANQMYENIMTAHEKAAEISVPVKAKIKQHVPWKNENIIEKKGNGEECL